MAKPVVLDSRTWPTRAAAKEYFKGVLWAYEVEDTVSDPEHDRLLRELLDRHPDSAEKIGSGVELFFIGRTDRGDKFNVRADARGVWIKRTDGSSVDFSYLTCIDQHTAKSDAKEAMRAAVDDRRMAYRAERFTEEPVASDLSGEPLPTRDSASVIYSEPEWAQLTYAFAQTEGGWESLAVHSGHGKIKIGSGFEDDALNERWLNFHEKHAHMQLASASEAARRLKPDERAWSPT